MGHKYKLRQYSEFEAFPHAFEKENHLKGKWNTYFKNDNPIVLELACGKGDYAIGLAKLYPEKNFIGIDIKGNRMWRGCKTVEEEGIKNVAFLRTYIDFIEEYFEKDEVAEMWITFPDPQPKKDRKRLTSPMFLDRYRKILKPNGCIKLKCDSDLLYEYTQEVIEEQKLTINENIKDVYALNEVPSFLEIKTYYEKKWLKEGRIIKYLSFNL